MADNTTINSGSGGDTIRTEDRTTFKTPVSLIDVGGTSGEALIGDAGNGMPCVGIVDNDENVAGYAPVVTGFYAKDFDGSALPGAVSAEGDAVQASGSLNGVQYVMCVNEDGSAVGTINAVCTNAGTFAVQAVCTNAGTFAVQAAQSGSWTVTGTGGTFPVTDSGGSLTVDAPVGTPVFVRLSDGSSAISTLPVSLASVPTHGVAGDVAHDAADSGNPVKIGLKAIAHGTNPTAVAAADRTDWYANRAGVPFVMGGHPNVKTHSVLVTDANGAQTNAAIVTVSAGTKIVVTRVSITADGDNSGKINCVVGFAASTLATPDTTTGGTGLLAAFYGIPAGGGMTVGDGSGILGIGADDEDLRYTCEDPAGGNLTISVTYYTIES